MKIIIRKKSDSYTSNIQNTRYGIRASPTMLTSWLRIVTAGLVNVYTKDEVREITGYDRNYVIDIDNIVNNI
jgi:hypothetical protein